MNAPLKTEVLIVGAGPTGLSLACQLTRYGVDCLVLEKREGVTPYSKALGVQARTLEIYEQMGLAEAAVTQGVIANKVRLLEGGEVRGELDLSGVGEGLSPYPFLLVLEQSRNEQLLYHYLRSQGKDVRWQTELQSFSQTGESVTAQFTDAAGAAQTVEARYAVGCDGSKSTVRHGLGLTLEGSTFERLFYVADVEIAWKFPHDALHLCMAKKSVVAFFPMKGENRYRIVGAFPEGMDRDEGDILYEEIERRIKLEAEIPLEISHVNWFSVYKVHSRHANRFSEGRCFLAGDSAHIHTPAGGQGMNTGIQDAYNLAWKLAYVLKHGASEQLLDSYNPERLENAKNLLKTTDRMFNIGAGSDWLMNVIRTTIFPPLAGAILRIDAVKHRFFTMISEIGIQYRDSALSDHAGDAHFAVKAGDRMPYFLVDGKSDFDLLRAPKFHLLAFSDGQADFQPIRDALQKEFAEQVDFHEIALYPHVTELFGANRPFLALLRPDNYIARLSSDVSPGETVAYLRRLIPS